MGLDRNYYHVVVWITRERRGMMGQTIMVVDGMEGDGGNVICRLNTLKSPHMRHRHGL